MSTKSAVKINKFIILGYPPVERFRFIQGDAACTDGLKPGWGFVGFPS